MGVERPRLLPEMLVDAACPGADVVFNFLIDGAPRFGVCPRLARFPPKEHRATKSVASLKASVRWVQRAVSGKVGLSGKHERDVAIYERTQEELCRRSSVGLTRRSSSIRSMARTG